MNRKPDKLDSDEMAKLLCDSIEWVLRGDEGKVDHNMALQRMAYLGHLFQFDGFKERTLEELGQVEFGNVSVDLWVHRKSFRKRFPKVVAELAPK